MTALMKILALLIGTAYHTSTTETVLGSQVLPANYLAPGVTVRVRGQVRITASEGATTLTVKVKVGPTTLTGTEVIAPTAVDAVDGDAFMFDLLLVCQAAGTAGTVGYQALFTTCDAVAVTGAAMLGNCGRLTSVNTTVAQRIEVTADWSASSASDSCILEYLVVDAA